MEKEGKRRREKGEGGRRKEKKEGGGGKAIEGRKREEWENCK